MPRTEDGCDDSSTSAPRDRSVGPKASDAGGEVREPAPRPGVQACRRRRALHILRLLHRHQAGLKPAPTLHPPGPPRSPDRAARRRAGPGRRRATLGGGRLVPRARAVRPVPSAGCRPHVAPAAGPAARTHRPSARRPSPCPTAAAGAPRSCARAAPPPSAAAWSEANRRAALATPRPAPLQGTLFMIGWAVTVPREPTNQRAP